tara:strand:+ start:431 stop:622 length:192 start_codon:yes stop_codon:yes gene_type:complete
VSGGVWLDTLYGVALIFMKFENPKLAGGFSGMVAFSSLAHAHLLAADINPWLVHYTLPLDDRK